MKRKRIFTKGISLLLAMIMTLSMLPLTAISSFAAWEKMPSNVTAIQAELKEYRSTADRSYTGRTITINKDGSFYYSKQLAIHPDPMHSDFTVYFTSK